MGKGAGCFPSKNLPPIGVSERDLPPPASGKNRPPIGVSERDLPPLEKGNPVSTEIQSPSAEITAPIQDGNGKGVVRKLRIFVVFYSMYGHVDLLARMIKKGVDSVDGVEGVLYRVPETLAPEILEQMRVPKKEDQVPVISVEELVEADGFLFGFPTRYGSMPSQMKAFFDSTFQLWEDQRLAGVPAGFFVGTGTQGGGQESTAWTAITQLVHHGMIYVPIGYTFGAGMFEMDSIRGGSPYGAGVFSGDGTRPPSETELALAQHQGKHMASTVRRFVRP